MKEKFTIQLKSSWPIKIIMSAALMAAFFVVCLRIVFSLVTQGCGQGWDGLGCAIGGVMLGYVITFVLLVGFGTFILQYFAIKNRAGAFLCMLPAGAILSVVNLYHGFEGLTPGFAKNPVVLLFWGAGLFAITLSLTLFLELLIFHFSNKVHWLLSVVLAALLVVGTCMGTPTLLDHIAHNQYQKQQSQGLQKITFNLYKPTYQLPGYHVFISRLKDPSTNRQPAFTLEYLYGTNESNDPRPYVLTYFAVPSTYNPPADCGHATPEFASLGHSPQSCILIAHSKVGCDVYYAAPRTVNMRSAFCKLDNTLVTIEVETNGLSKEEMVKIFDSLQPSTGKELQKLAP